MYEILCSLVFFNEVLWDVEYIDILKSIPETVRKMQSPSPHKPERWRNFDRLPIRTRSRAQKSDSTARQDQYDDDPPSPTPERSIAYGSRRTPATHTSKGSEFYKGSKTNRQGKPPTGSSKQKVGYIALSNVS